MTSVSAELWGCPGLSVSVHRHDNNGIGAPLWQLAGPATQDTKHESSKYLISEKDVRFAVPVRFQTELHPINNILIGDILGVDLFFDGFHVCSFLCDTEVLLSEGHAHVVTFRTTANPATELPDSARSQVGHSSAPPPDDLSGLDDFFAGSASGSRGTAGTPANKRADWRRSAPAQRARDFASAARNAAATSGVGQIIRNGGNTVDKNSSKFANLARGSNSVAVTDRGSSNTVVFLTTVAAAPATGTNADSVSNPAALVPDGENSNATTVPVNSTVEFGSVGGHSPPHKKQKLDEGDAGGDTGDNNS